jgi:hypothetical protein
MDGINKARWIITIVIAAVVLSATLFAYWILSTPQNDNSPDLTESLVLKNSLLTPAAGYANDTLFNYSVVCIFSGGTLIEKEIVIDGIFHSMTPVNETVFSYSTIFTTSGGHDYYFAFKTINLTSRLPESGRFYSPLVSAPLIAHSMNLSSGRVSPSSGMTDMTVFNYTVIYKDSLNHAPIVMRVYIDGSPHTMAPIGSGYSEGCEFFFETTLSVDGTHDYYFECSCVASSFRFPFGNDKLYAPEIKIFPHVTTLSSPFVTPTDGTVSTVFTYSVI